MIFFQAKTPMPSVHGLWTLLLLLLLLLKLCNMLRINENDTCSENDMNSKRWHVEGLPLRTSEAPDNLNKGFTTIPHAISLRIMSYPAYPFHLFIC